MQKNVVEAAGVIAVATVTANTVMQVRMTSEYICRSWPVAVYVTTSAVGFFSPPPIPSLYFWCGVKTQRQGQKRTGASEEQNFSEF